MDKLKFEFVMKQSEDPKTNILCITSIMDAEQNMFIIPEQLQPAKLHDVVMKTQAFSKIKTTLQRRHEKRKVWISMTQDLRDTYMDADGNMQFKGYLLEEATKKTQELLSTSEISTDTLTRILENFAELKKESKQLNLENLSEKFVLERFTRRTTSVTQWMATFEAECVRIGIGEDIQKIQVLRLFLDDSCQDWYNSMLIKYTINSEWCIWKTSFCETYTNKGWTPIRYAILFKYRQGSLLEYALKKERLLLEVNKCIDNSTLIDLIATGLPNFIADQIDRNKLKNTEDLYSSIRGLEHFMNKRIVEKKGILEGIDSRIKENKTKEKACKICEKEKKGTRYHPESVCWFKNKDNDRFKKESIRSVNNSELEMSLNEIDPKNL